MSQLISWKAEKLLGNKHEKRKNGQILLDKVFKKILTKQLNTDLHTAAQHGQDPICNPRLQQKET